MNRHSNAGRARAVANAFSICSQGISPYASAARAEDLAGLPPAFISVGALDLLFEEDLEYARRLARSGVPVELHVYPGGLHGFELAADSHLAKEALRTTLTALRYALHGAALIKD